MLLKREPAVNFVEIILDLRREPHRFGLQSIADAINVNVATLKGWFYDSHSPNFEDGRALLALHRALSNSRQSDELTTETVLQSPSRAHDAPCDQQERAMASRKPKTVKQPGDDPQSGAAIPGQEAGVSDVDAAIDAGARGRAHKVEKPRPPVAPAKIVGPLDDQRPKSAPVNSKREMSYAEAMRAHDAGTLERSVLTEQGWVFPKAREIPKGARV